MECFHCSRSVVGVFCLQTNVLKTKSGDFQPHEKLFKKFLAFLSCRQAQLFRWNFSSVRSGSSEAERRDLHLFRENRQEK